MPPVRNWERVLCRRIDDVGLTGTVRKWRNDLTGDTVAIRVDKDSNDGRRYDIIHNREVVTARDTIDDAKDSVMITLRENTEGL